MDTKPRTLKDINLTDPDVFKRDEHHGIFRRMRSEAPVMWHERSWGPGFWNVTKYEDLIRISRDPETFISGQGIVLDNTGERTQREQQLGVQMAGTMMIMTDPPRHQKMRQLVNKGFTPRSVARLEPKIREICNGIIDDVIDRGECDFVMDISRRLPLDVICQLVGVPDGDWEAMFELSNRIIGFDDPEYAPQQGDMTQQLQMSQELTQYFLSLCEERRQNPTDDVLTKLVQAEIDGDRLNDFELYMFFILLIVAGNETTRNSMSGGILQLMRHPDQMQRLAQDPGLIPVATEEFVRYTSPVMHFFRTATKDVELRGQQIREGDQVVLWYPAVNRDEDVFGGDAEDFKIDRSPNEHLGFGIGEHFCLGANLARLEIIVMFEELMRRIPHWELNGEPEKLRSNFIGGIKRMPVRFTPA